MPRVLLFPPSLRISSQQVTPLDNTAFGTSIFTGAVTTTDPSGASGDRFRFGIKIDHATNAANVAERAMAMSLRSKARGKQNRILFSPGGTTLRGSFPATELLTNNSFTSGTSGWSGTNATLSAADGMLRLTSLTGAQSSNAYQTNITVTQYAPYVARAFTSADTAAIGNGPYVVDSSALIAHSLSSGTGMKSASYVSRSAIEDFLFYGASDAGALAGKYAETAFCSLSRCMLVDAGTNLLTYSDELNNAAWTKVRSTVTANGATAPDGTATGDWIVEDSTASNTHYVITSSATVSASVTDICFTIALAPNSRTWAQLVLYEATAGSVVTAYFNLSTGAMGTATTGVNWSNFRSFTPTDLGNNWRQYTIIARKTNAATSVAAYVVLATGDLTISYSGDGVSKIGAWRATLAQSSVPVRLAQTVATVTNGTGNTSSGIYVKGLPVSTTGLLLAGDYVQIGNQLGLVANSLNSDAAGLGYLELAWPLRTTPADNDPVIVNTPMGRFYLPETDGGWSDMAGGISDFDFVLEEALDA